MLDESFFRPHFDDPAFWFLAYGLGGLFLLAVGFSFVAIVLRRRNDRAIARRKRLKKEWEAMLLKMLAGEVTVMAFQESVFGKDRPFFLSFLYRYARRLKGKDLRTVQQVAAPLLHVGTARLKRGSAEERAHRIQMLGQLGFPAHEEAVVAALDDPAPLVAMAALRALTQHGGAAHLPALIEALPRFASWSTQSLAALLQKAGPAAGPPLREMLADAEQPARVRVIAAEALRLLDDLEAAEEAARVAGRTSEPTAVREAALRLLARVGQRAHLPLVRSLTEEDYDERVRIRAFEALSQRADASEAPRLEAALHDDSRWVALHAAEGLRRLGRTDLLRTLAASDHPRAALAQQAVTEQTLISA